MLCCVFCLIIRRPPRATRTYTLFPYPTLFRSVQSADVILRACDGHQQRRIERRAARSWSLVLYEPIDGPFRVANLSATTLTPSDERSEEHTSELQSLMRT